MDQHPDFQMLGPDVVLPSVTIKSICDNVQFVSSAEYIKSQYNIRPELCENLFTAVCNVFGQ